jgi:hypothetical protein
MMHKASKMLIMPTTALVVLLVEVISCKFFMMFLIVISIVRHAR